MCICVYVYMCICVYVYVRVYIYIYIILQCSRGLRNFRVWGLGSGLGLGVAVMFVGVGIGISWVDVVSAIPASLTKMHRGLFQNALEVWLVYIVTQC